MIKGEKMLANAPVGKVIWKLALPAILTTLISTIYNQMCIRDSSQVGSAEVSEVGSAATSVSGSEEVSVTGVSLVSGAASSGDGASVCAAGSAVPTKASVDVSSSPAAPPISAMQSRIPSIRIHFFIGPPSVCCQKLG